MPPTGAAARDPEDLARYLADRLHTLDLPFPGLAERPEEAVVGLDGSAESRAAAAWAARLAGRVHLVASIGQSVPALEAVGGHTAVQGWQERARSGARQVLDATASELSEQVETFEHLTDEPAVPALLTLAEEKRAGLVAVGRSGKGAVERALLGSVSATLGHRGNRPTLVATDPPGPGPVVVGVGEDPSTPAAVGWAGRIAQVLDAKLILARASPEAYAPPGFREAGPEAESLVLDWPPRESLAELAQARQASALVVGHGRRPGWLGSTALGVLHRCPCTTLIVHRPVLG